MGSGSGGNFRVIRVRVGKIFFKKIRWHPYLPTRAHSRVIAHAYAAQPMHVGTSVYLSMWVDFFMLTAQPTHGWHARVPACVGCANFSYVILHKPKPLPDAYSHAKMISSWSRPHIRIKTLLFYNILNIFYPKTYQTLICIQNSRFLNSSTINPTHASKKVENGLRFMWHTIIHCFFQKYWDSKQENVILLEYMHRYRSI